MPAKPFVFARGFCELAAQVEVCVLEGSNRPSLHIELLSCVLDFRPELRHLAVSLGPEIGCRRPPRPRFGKLAFESGLARLQRDLLLQPDFAFRCECPTHS